MKNFFFFILFFLSVSLPTLAQKDEKPATQKWMGGAAAILAEIFVIDKTLSSIPYSGINGGASLHIINNGKRLSHSFAASYLAGNLKTDNEEAGIAKNEHANFDYTLLFNLTQTDASWLSCSIGGGVDLLYANRKYNKYINSNTAFEFASSLHVSGLVRHTFGDVSNRFSIYNQLNFPFISYLVQSPFGYNNLVSSGKSSFYNKDIVSFSSFLRFSNCLGFEKSIRSNQKISLSYSWDYYRIKKIRDVNSASHCIAFTYYHTL